MTRHNVRIAYRASSPGFPRFERKLAAPAIFILFPQRGLPDKTCGRVNFLEPNGLYV